MVKVIMSTNNGSKVERIVPTLEVEKVIKEPKEFSPRGIISFKKV